MIFFPNATIELWEYNETESYNIYGEPLNNYIYKESVNVDFQPMSPSEDVRVFGEVRKDTYKIYLDSSTPITNTMKIRYNDWSYEIIGNPLVYDHNIQPHIKIIVQKERINTLNES